MKKIYFIFRNLKLWYRILIGILFLGLIIFCGYSLILWTGAKTKAQNSSSGEGASNRKEEIAYLALDSNMEGGDLWRISLDTDRTATLLTETGGKVIDFNVSHNGEFLVYSTQNNSGGDDLWIVNRYGTDAHLLVDCGVDHCLSAVWSMDNTQIAYANEEDSPDVAVSAGASRIWLVDVASGQTVLLYQDRSILGANPSWSPDGKKIAFYDAGSQNIHVLNLETKKEILLPTRIEMVGCWSPDSQKMLFNDIQIINEAPTVIIYQADLTDNSILPFIGGDSIGTDYYIPAWSPDGLWIAIGSGSSSGASGKQIEILNPDGREYKMITNDLTYSHSSYHWDFSGKKLLYQQYKLGQAITGPSIMVWDMATGETTTVVENGALPEWIS
jgi:Tol biopolymer transport system component